MPKSREQIQAVKELKQLEIKKKKLLRSVSSSDDAGLSAINDKIKTLEDKINILKTRDSTTQSGKEMKAMAVANFKDSGKRFRAAQAVAEGVIKALDPTNALANTLQDLKVEDIYNVLRSHQSQIEDIHRMINVLIQTNSSMQNSPPTGDVVMAEPVAETPSKTEPSPSTVVAEPVAQTSKTEPSSSTVVAEPVAQTSKTVPTGDRDSDGKLTMEGGKAKRKTRKQKKKKKAKRTKNRKKNYYT